MDETKLYDRLKITLEKRELLNLIQNIPLIITARRYLANLMNANFQSLFRNFHVFYLPPSPPLPPPPPALIAISRWNPFCLRDKFLRALQVTPNINREIQFARLERK